MSTPVNEIYDRFLKRIGKDTLTDLIAQGQIDVVEDVMMTYLEDAIVYFDTLYKTYYIYVQPIVHKYQQIARYKPYH